MDVCQILPVDAKKYLTDSNQRRDLYGGCRATLRSKKHNCRAGGKRGVNSLKIPRQSEIAYKLVMQGENPCPRF